MKKCYLYFIQMQSVGPIKIGIAQDVGRRLAELQVGSPYDLNLLHAQEIETTKIEREVHSHLKNYHMRGEWFSPTPEVYEVIEDIKRHDYVVLRQKIEMANCIQDDGEYIRPHCVNTPCVWLNVRQLQ